MIRLHYILCIILFATLYADMPDSPLLAGFVNELDEKFTEIITNSGQCKLQIIYTQINREENNNPIFETHTFRFSPREYFYPASTIKFPIAVLALEKLNSINVVNRNTPLSIFSGLKGLEGVSSDPTSNTGLPSITHYIHKLFVVSDNDAFNRLYEFLGRDQINQRLWDLGFIETRIRHRLSIALSEEQNRYSNAFRFYNQDKIIFEQLSQKAQLYLDINYDDYFIGKANIKGGNRIQEPLDFSGKNFMNLWEQHHFLQAIIFPNFLNNNSLLNLTDEDYQFLYREMSILPRESLVLAYNDYGHYSDGHGKFILYGDSKDRIPDNVRIFNKVGMAYGFVLDNAYVIDFENKVEFLLSAVVYVNHNETLNDNKYEYDELSLPFMAALGKIVYEYELSRAKKHLPVFNRFNLGYWPD